MTQLGPVLTNALSFWERKGRVPYNLVLAVQFVLHYLGQGSPRSWTSPESLLNLFLLAVAANLCYCAAYLVDVPVQLSEFREAWLPYRWLLWALGMAVAMALAHLVCCSGSVFPLHLI